MNTDATENHSNVSMAAPKQRVTSYANPRTPQGRMGITLEVAPDKKDSEAIELRIEDKGMDHIFQWKRWKGTRAHPEAPDSRDSAALFFRGDCARDALIYGLWKAADNLFQMGYGMAVLDVRLDLYKLKTFLHHFTFKVEVIAINSTGVDGQYTYEVATVLTDLDDAPKAAHQAYLQRRGDRLVAVALRFRMENPFRPTEAPLMLYKLAVLEKIHDEKKHGHQPTMDDFYFDPENEERMVRELLTNYFLLLTAFMAKGFEVGVVNSELRELLVMSDVCAQHKKLHGL